MDETKQDLKKKPFVKDDVVISYNDSIRDDITEIVPFQETENLQEQNVTSEKIKSNPIYSALQKVSSQTNRNYDQHLNAIKASPSFDIPQPSIAPIISPKDYSKCQFHWVKTERTGDVCEYKDIINENGIEYILFTDNSRITSSLIGDVVIAVENKNIPNITENDINKNIYNESIKQSTQIQDIQEQKDQEQDSPVASILDKSKKRNVKLNISLSIEIPPVQLYRILVESFDGVDEVIIENVLEQISQDILKSAVKKEVMNIYKKRKKQ